MIEKMRKNSCPKICKFCKYWDSKEAGKIFGKPLGRCQDAWKKGKVPQTLWPREDFGCVCWKARRLKHGELQAQKQTGNPGNK